MRILPLFLRVILGLCFLAAPWTGFCQAPDDPSPDDGLSPRRTWRGPDTSTFGFQVFRGEEQLDLVVPEEFAGRSGKDKRRVFGVEMFEWVRATRTEGAVELRGLSSVFDFQYKRDDLEAILFESHAARPGTNACMDCHGGRAARSVITVGRETTEFTPEPLKRGAGSAKIAAAVEESTRISINHWLTKRWQLNTGFRSGHIQNGSYNLHGTAVSLGANGEIAPRLLWDITGIWSNTQTFSRKRILESHITWRPGRRLKIVVGGGAFLDGLAYFGANMTELGQMSVGLEKEDSTYLPALFKTLKDRQFGYLHSSVMYEYPF